MTEDWDIPLLITLLFGKVFISWMVFYFFHSFLLLKPIRDSIIEGFKSSPQAYRIVYNLFSALSLLLVLIIQFEHQAAYQFAIPSSVKILAAAVLIFSIYMLKQSFKNYRLSVFIGLEKETQMAFSASGLNAVIRHPLYSFSLLAFLSTAVILPSSDSVQMFLAVVLYVQIGYRLEERKLIEVFGEPYREYQKAVPALLPSLFSKKSAV